MSDDLREELTAVINAAGREVDLNAVRALVDHVQPKLDRLAFELRHTRAELGKADTENNAAGKRAERAEAAIERGRQALTAALTEWQPEYEYRRERADRKGYSHDEAAADAYGAAIEAVTDVLAALDPPKETP